MPHCAITIRPESDEHASLLLCQCTCSLNFMMNNVNSLSGDEQAMAMKIIKNPGASTEPRVPKAHYVQKVDVRRPDPLSAEHPSCQVMVMGRLS